jgi:hypothetical protein
MESGMETSSEGWKKNPQSRQQMTETNRQLNRRCQQLEHDLAVLTKSFVKYAAVASVNIKMTKQQMENARELRRELEKEVEERKAVVSAGRFASFGPIRRLLWRLFFARAT